MTATREARAAEAGAHIRALVAARGWTADVERDGRLVLAARRRALATRRSDPAAWRGDLAALANTPPPGGDAMSRAGLAFRII